MDLKINKEFKDLIPPLSQDEYNSLEKSILDEGCRDALIVWDEVIVDGHNRYEICKNHNIDFETLQKDFASVEDAKVWMIDNQKGRRNLTDGWKWELAQARKALLEVKGEEKYKQTVGRPKKSLSTIDNDLPKHNTQKEIAKDLGWSTGKVAMAEKVWKEADDETKEKVKSGDVSINAAYNEVKQKKKKEERKKYIEKQKKDIESANIIKPEGLFDILVFDPPWPYGREYDPASSRVANPYPEMQINEIREINVPSKDSSIIFLWTTHKFLPDSFDILKAWGFDYKATMVWNKQKMGMGYWLRMQCEFCLLGIKGKPIWDVKDWRDIFSESRREHSRKPDSFYEAIDHYFPFASKLEYFSREKRDGWHVFGNDVNKF